MNTKHDIDKLFSKKLDSLESAPSPDAWLKLEKNLQDKRKRWVIWIPYAAAAAITLLLVSIWVINGWENPNRESLTDVPKQMPQMQQKEKPKSSVNESSVNSSGTKVQPDKKEPHVALEQEKSNSSVKRPAKEAAGRDEKKAIPIIQRNTTKDTESKVKMIEVEDKIALQEHTPTVPKATLSQQPTVTVVVQVNALDAPATTVELDKEGVDEPNKQTKAGKILAKLKKIKKAEFEELGIDRQSIIAFVKDKTGKH